MEETLATVLLFFVVLISAPEFVSGAAPNVTMSLSFQDRKGKLETELGYDEMHLFIGSGRFREAYRVRTCHREIIGSYIDSQERLQGCSAKDSSIMVVKGSVAKRNFSKTIAVCSSMR